MTDNNNEEELLDELGSIKYQLDGGPEHQPSIPELDLFATPLPTETKAREAGDSTDLETLIDELDDKHLPKLEQQLRSAIDDT